MKKHIECALVTAFNNKKSFVWHETLGSFQSEWHEHNKGQLMFAENGCIHINIEGKSLLLPSWYGAWIPAGMSHFIWSESPQVSISTIYFEREAGENDMFAQASVFPMSNLLKEMIGYTLKWYKSESNRPEETFLMAIKDLLPDQMSKSAHVCLPSTNHIQLLRILKALQDHLHENWSLVTVANKFTVSPRTLTRMFTKNLNISFSRYCKIAKSIRALELIEMGADNVSQIAAMVGYGSVSTFSNNFLEICGKRPHYFINIKRP